MTRTNALSKALGVRAVLREQPRGPQPTMTAAFGVDFDRVVRVVGQWPRPVTGSFSTRE